MKKVFFLILALFAFHQSDAQWNDVKSFEVNFKIKNFGRYVNGFFKRYNVNINFNEAEPSKSILTGSVEVRSINTAKEKRDAHLIEKQQFFYAIKYPKIIMKAVSITPLNKNEYQVLWNVIMKGVTKRVESVLHTSIENDMLILTTQVKINRLKWDVGENSFVMSDNVLVDIAAKVGKK